MRSAFRFPCMALLLALAPAHAAVPQSRPQPAPLPPPLPVARDIAYPGAIRLTVDATDTARGIFRVRETIPVAPGPLILLYPQWLPGKHAPRGPIESLAGLRFTADGQTLKWRRDPVMVYAFHLDVPPGAREIAAEFQYVSPTAENQGRIVVTPDMLNLQWNLVALYPAGYFVRDIPFAATAILPPGWRYGTALAPLDPAATGTISFRTTDFETLVDSPILAGRWFRQEPLGPGVRLDIVADSADELAATPAQIEAHRALVTQADRLFGARHFDHYDFLLAITDRLGKIGLEHHRSSENSAAPGYFTKWAENAPGRNVLPHEYVHSWNGKYRRGADLWTPDYSVPMRDSLLWVYEGLTQYWGYVLQARSGLVSKEDTLAALAMAAALYDTRVGRVWRPLADTTNDPIVARRRPLPWRSWQRSEDYYGEGMLLWLEADMKIRLLTGNKRSLDDFARAFFGVNDGDGGVLTYTREDVVRALNGIAPYDWEGFFRERVDEARPRAPLDGIAEGGYRLVYTSRPTRFWKQDEKEREVADLRYSLGVVIGKESVLAEVAWDSPAFAAGLTVGTKIVGLNGNALDKADAQEALQAAVVEAARARKPITLLVQQGDLYRTVSIPYYGGPHYPRLERAGGGPALLDKVLAPLP